MQLYASLLQPSLSSTAQATWFLNCIVSILGSLKMIVQTWQYVNRFQGKQYRCMPVY